MVAGVRSVVRQCDRPAFAGAGWLRRRRGFALAGLLAGLLSCSVESAQIRPGGAGAYIKSVGQEVIAVIRNPRLDAVGRKAALREVFKKSFDTDAIGRFALGRHWRIATAKQKVRYLKILPDYVADVYAGQISTYAGEIFVVIRERQIGKSQSFVNAQIRRAGKKPLDVDFRVLDRPEGFRIFDVFIERVSLLVAKRDEFSSIIRREGMARFLERLQRRTENI